jgi:hypothetical protein
MGDLRVNALLGRDADVTLVACFTRLTATMPQFSGIVTAPLGKTAREGGS